MPLLSIDQSSEVLSRRRLSQTAAAPAGAPIPARVLQFWDRDPPGQVRTLLERNRTLCAQAGAEYVLVDAAQARAFIAAFGSPLHLQAYDIAVHPAMKCDVFRLCYLARRGGFYVDADLVLRPNLAELLALQGGLVVFQWDKQNLSNLCNWLIGANAGQPTLEAALDATASSIVEACSADAQQALKNILNVSGPGIFTRAVASHLASTDGVSSDHAVNIQTVSRAHQLIELGPTYLAAPLEYKNDHGDQRHWRTAAGGAANGAQAAPASATQPAAPAGLKDKLVGWLGGRSPAASPAPAAPVPPAAAQPSATASSAPQADRKPLAATVRDNGQRNTIDLHDSAFGQVNIVINGHDNKVRVGAGSHLQNLRIDIRGNHCEIDIGEECVLIGEFICREHRTRLLVGRKTTTMGAKITMHESGLIRIGEDCMFAGDVRMDTSDMHSIIDVASGERINPPGDIEIGAHVWLGYGTYVLKSVQIGAHSIVGARAVVSDDIPPHSLAVGVPARVIRTGVTWDRRRLPMPGSRKT